MGYRCLVIITTNSDVMASRNNAAALDLGDFVHPNRPAPRQIVPAQRAATHVKSVIE
jgi:hypothetical protein